MGEVTDAIFTCISNIFGKYKINLRLSLTGRLNTNFKMIKNESDKDIKVAIPKYSNVAYNLKQRRFVIFDIESGDIPYFALRSAKLFVIDDDESLRIIYDCCDEMHMKNGACIEAFSWKCPKWIDQVLPHIEYLSDKKILEWFSTSPYAEYDGFANDAKTLWICKRCKTTECVSKWKAVVSQTWNIATS